MLSVCLCPGPPTEQDTTFVSETLRCGVLHKLGRRLENTNLIIKDKITLKVTHRAERDITEC